MTTVSEYIGRLSDLAMFTNVSLDGERKLVQTLAAEGTGGLIVAGIQKLVQRFMIELLTERSTVYGQPRRGCDFMTRLLRNSLNTSLAVEQAFNSAVIDIQRNLLLEETSDMPTDERFGSAVLRNLSVNRGEVVLYVALTSAAGTEHEVLLPIATTPGPT